MHRILSILCLLLVFSSTPAVASVDRLTALGGLSQALIDDSNGFVFPASLGEWPRFEVELFDEWAGLVYPLSKQHTLGLYFNRQTTDLRDFTRYIEENGSDLFRAMTPSPWFDLAYSFAASPSVAIGASASLAHDHSTLATREASATNTDLRLGLRLGSGRTLDIGLGFRLRRLQDQTLAGVTFNQSDGTGLLLDMRYRWPINAKTTLLPYLGLARDAFALAPEQRTQTTLRLGTGLQLQPAPSVLLIAAVDGHYQQTDRSQQLLATSEEKSLLLPAWILAGEVQVGSMLFRLGVRHESKLHDLNRLQNEQWVKSSSFGTTFTTHLGLGIEFSNLLLDGLLERDFLRDGPHFIGGSRHGGGILSQLSLTYRFNPPGK